MEIIETSFSDLFILKSPVFNDERGTFIKDFNASLFEQLGVSFSHKEEYFSFSNKNTIRGMHFQTPPHGHKKIVSCLVGEILDVVVDLRKNSKTYNKVYSTILKEKSGISLIIPEGFAHGFLSLTENALVQYKVSSEYSQAHDCGIKWDSIDFNWPVTNPIVSKRDQKFPPCHEFASPF